MMRITDTVKHLIIINVLFYIGSFLFPAIGNMLMLYFPSSQEFKLWQPITYMFMHDKSSFLHILFNMIGVWMFGSALETMWGPKKFIFFYISCGLGAAALHVGINYYTYYSTLNLLIENGYAKDQVISLISESRYNPQWLELITEDELHNFVGGYVSPMLGASGALYGVIVAFAFMFPNVELMLMFIPVPIKAKYFVPGLLAIDLFLGLKGQAVFGSGGDGIAHFAHLGGALIGFIMMWYWKQNEHNNRRWN